MSLLISFNPDDLKALEHLCARTGMSKTGLLRKLVWSYAQGRTESLDLISMRGREYPGPGPFDAERAAPAPSKD